MTSSFYLLEIEGLGLFTQESQPGRIFGESVGGMFALDCSDWCTRIESNGLRFVTTAAIPNSTPSLTQETRVQMRVDDGASTSNICDGPTTFRVLSYTSSSSRVLVRMRRRRHMVVSCASNSCDFRMITGVKGPEVSSGGLLFKRPKTETEWWHRIW